MRNVNNYSHSVLFQRRTQVKQIGNTGLLFLSGARQDTCASDVPASLHSQDVSRRYMKIPTVGLLPHVQEFDIRLHYARASQAS